MAFAAANRCYTAAMGNPDDDGVTMTIRATDLQTFLDATREAIAQSATPGAGAMAERVFAAMERPAPEDAPDSARLPVCEHLDAALANARQAGAATARVADALAALSPRLAWQRRPGAERLSAEFFDAHATTVLAGPDGLEQRDDVRIGISLLAPKTQYPDHRHPPEEIYLALSGSEWRQKKGPWHAPGPGGLVHNPPDIVHGMRSLDAPLLAVWCLWVG